MPRRLPSALIALSLFYLTSLVGLSQVNAGPRTDTPSGMPVPRFVSLKHDKTNCRAGPGFDYPIAVTFLKVGLPVKIIAETTDHWRKIQDADGAACWAHQTTLKGVSHIVVQTEVSLLSKPDSGSYERARLEPGVMARIERESDDWLLLSVSGLRGWAPKAALWGAPR